MAARIPLEAIVPPAGKAKEGVVEVAKVRMEEKARELAKGWVSDSVKAILVAEDMEVATPMEKDSEVRHRSHVQAL